MTQSGFISSDMRTHFDRTRVSTPYLTCAFLLIGIAFTSLHSYLLFHTAAETFSILVSFSIFLFAWNTRRFSRDRYLMVLGTAYLFSGGFDFLHMLSYKGMEVFAVHGSNLATQAWIIARGIEAGSLLAIPFLFRRQLNYTAILSAYAIASIILFFSLEFDLFPDCYREGTGLTSFKIACEYFICILLAAAGIMLHRRRGYIEKIMYQLLMASIGFTIASELAFTLYTGVYGYINGMGHLLKIISFYLIYRAIVVYGLRKPYQIMFRELNDSKTELERYSGELEYRVAERTRELEQRHRELKFLSGQLMMAEENERKRIARDLHDSLGQSLSAVKLNVENTIVALRDRIDPADMEALERLIPITRMAISDVRRIIMDLRPSVLDDMGIVTTVGWLCREFNNVYPDMVIRSQVAIAEEQVPETIKTPVFRLLQEAMNNIGKHSGASSVSVSLGLENSRICLKVIDNGCGFDPEAAASARRHGYGLSGMRERAEISGARFDIQSRQGIGTTICAMWPNQLN